MHRSLLSVVATMVAVCCGGCSFGPRVWTESDEVFRFPLASVQAVDVKTHNGGVKVRPADGAEAIVEAHIRAGGRDLEDAEACLEDLQLVVAERDGVLTATYALPNRRPGWGIQVSFTVSQPSSAATKVVTHNGRVDVEGVEAGVSVVTHNGGIRVTDCHGVWRARTHNGSIEASGASGEVHLQTHNGQIVAAIAGEGSLAGSVRTHNGSVTLDLESDRNTELECVTHNGGIRVSNDFQVVRAKRRSFRGVLGEGGSELSVVTHNGSIRVGG